MPVAPVQLITAEAEERSVRTAGRLQRSVGFYGLTFVSLGSIIAVATFPLLVFVMRAYENVLLALVCMAITSLLIVVKHHENIRRLIAGTENRIGAKRA